MRYRVFFVVLFCIASLLIAFMFNQKAKQSFFRITDKIKFYFIDTADMIKNNYERFFNQADNISFYKERYRESQKVQLELIELKEKFNKILGFYPQLNLYPSVIFEPALVVSYVELLQYDKVWLQTKQNYPKNKILGIVRDGYALGIAIVEQDRLLGLFNGNERCSYSVYVGKNKIPALLHQDTKNSNSIIADFIPQYFVINEGDEVFTSGLDDIFIENIPVGKVQKVMDQNGYIGAIVKPYADIKSPDFLWIINKENDAK